MEIKIEFVSQQIRNLREARQLTQEELAHELGVSRQSIIALERGRCLPSLPLALHMAEIFDLMLDDMIRPETEFKMLEASHEEQEVELEELENEWRAKFPLPENVDHNGIVAEIQDNMLNITMPKRKIAAPRVIKIKIKND